MKKKWDEYETYRADRFLCSDNIDGDDDDDNEGGYATNCNETEWNETKQYKWFVEHKAAAKFN